ncbi:hypothetical protein [Halobellus sp. GM3]|uniref:hypothetical protein n=1 Tax=Halobellus sp. GM3 TaxID=3458410 RepID=UPI00403DDB96
MSLSPASTLCIGGADIDATDPAEGIDVSSPTVLWVLQPERDDTETTMNEHLGGEGRVRKLRWTNL